MKCKKTPIVKKRYILDIDVNTSGIDSVLPIDSYPIEDIDFDSIPLPIDPETKEQVAGEWKLRSDFPLQEGAKLFIPLFYNKIEMVMVFHPEDTKQYSDVESVLRFNLKNQPKRLFFSGTRGRWFL